MFNPSEKQLTLARLDSFIEQIQRIQELYFPYEDSQKALHVIESHIKDQRVSVDQSVLTGTQLHSRCARSTHQIFAFHRIIGYLVNSANSKSSFEIYFSFRRLAESILGSETHLIISSEWEHYSPVNFNLPPELVDFVFIGMPVAEADNPLTVPLAGHELGHTIWNKHSIRNKIVNDIQARVQSRLPKATNIEMTSQVVEITINKCAEFFCDFIGFGIFGKSYPYAYAYLLAPQRSNKLVGTHPNCSNRAKALTRAAVKFGFKMPEDYETLFTTIPKPPSNLNEVALEITEDESFNYIDNLIDEAKTILSNSNCLYSESDSYANAISELESMTPTSSSRYLADITNATWKMYLDENLWPNTDKPRSEKVMVLRELAIKSFEILEITQRLQGHDTEIR